MELWYSKHAMASEEDQEVFEITDFTTATEWERFVAQLEEVIHEWKLTNVRKGLPLKKGDISNGNWKKNTQEVCFADTRFNLIHHSLVLDEEESLDSPEEPIDEPIPQALEDMMSMENDFPCRAHCLARWYGLREFVVVAPLVYPDCITSESKAKLVLSSICIAVNNANCYIPVFVQLHQLQQSYYLGICEGGGIRTNFEMVHLKKAPAQCNHLTGLLDIFKTKLANPINSVPVIISIRFTYVLQDWPEFFWPQQPPDFDVMMGEVGITKLGQLPFGACEDPISELHLSTIWPCLSEDVIVDSDIYSDLDPLQAPVWTVRIQMIDNPPCLLSEYLMSFLRLSEHKESLSHILGKTEMDTTDASYTQPLNRLTDFIPLPNVSSVVNQSKHQSLGQPEYEPIPGSQLQPILFFLFPDANDDQPDNLETLDAQTTDPNASGAGVSSFSVKQEAKSKECFVNFKSAPPDSLTYRLAVSLCHVNHVYKGLEAFAHLWNEFILEMRYRWDIAHPIPGLELGVPNLGCCLLHQKLQMLNCCIERKRNREQRQRRVWTDDDKGWDSSSEEEFYECSEKPSSSSVDSSGKKNDSNQEVKPSSLSSNTSIDVSFKDSLTHQPDGRLRRCGDLRLLHSDLPLYIPITQEPTPMTEDLLEEHAEVLIKLGTDAEGSQLRAKMQSACLLSDMEAFKAANPSCCLEDFVRWYSPRDWIEEEVMDEETGKTIMKGHLSARMLISDNMWEDVWETAKPVPSRRQKRLFDDTTEAEKVLHWMASLKPAEVVMHLMPVLIHAALITLSQIDEPVLKSLPVSFEAICERTAKLTRAPKVDQKRYEDVIHLISQAEVLVARCHSLREKLSSQMPSDAKANETSELESLVHELLEKPEVIIPGGSHGVLGSAIHRLFIKAQRAANMLIDDSPTSEEERPIHHSRPRRSSLSSRHPALPDFPKPAGREYILRTTVPRPAPYSIPTPQRMFCVLQQDDVRLAGAFSQDTTFQ